MSQKRCRLEALMPRLILANGVGNRLYCGDTLAVLRRYVVDECVDLVCLDPPFNSNATYNVLFADQTARLTAPSAKPFIGHVAGHRRRCADWSHNCRTGASPHGPAYPCWSRPIE